MYDVWVCVCGVYLKSYCGLGLVQQSIKYAHKCMKWQFHEKENTLCVGRGSKAFVPSTLTQAHTRSTIHPRRGTILLYTNIHIHMHGDHAYSIFGGRLCITTLDLIFSEQQCDISYTRPPSSSS